jgi:hypothetical protein
MGMFSEIATEGTIRDLVKFLENELELATPDGRDALKRVGRYALTQFEWSTPDWAKKYVELFKE